MRLRIPLTGTVLVEGSVWGKGELKGDDQDSIRPVDIDLGNVSWTMVDIDLEQEVMIIEVSPADSLDEPTGELDPEGKPKYRNRPTTPSEKQQLLDHARSLIEGKTKEELYQISKCTKLKRAK